MTDTPMEPWDAEGQEILERAQIRIEALYEISSETDDVEAVILEEEAELLTLLVERGRAILE